MKTDKHRVLIVDDEESIRFTLHRYLEQTGYQVELARGMDDARALMDKTRFDVIIVDRMLSGGQNGLNLLAEIHKSQPLCQTILISGYPSFESASKAIQHELFAYLAKPVRKNEILSTVADAVKHGEKKRESLHRETLFDSLFNSSPAPVAICNLKGRIHYANPAFSRIFGFDDAVLPGGELPVFKPESSVSDSEACTWEGFFADVLDGKTVSDVEMTFLSGKGEKTETAVTLSVCLDEDGKPSEFIVIFRDISHSKSLERQLIRSQKAEAIGTLASGIAHDFNNLLSPIIGYSEMCQAELSENTEHYHYNNQILNAALRARSLVQQILTFSRKEEEDKGALFIQYILKEALKFLRASLPPSIEIRQDINKRCRPILADPTRIHQIIMNLCTNAYHAMRENGGILEARLREIETSEGPASKSPEDSGPTRYAEISISDSGDGIPPDIREKIFDPYFTTKKKGEGTGLGLSVVQGIVKAYNGRIRVSSEMGKGACFTITFPCVEMDFKEIPEPALGIQMGNNEHILLVDDETIILGMMEKTLKNQGYRVTARSSGQGALSEFLRNPEGFDLLITDMEMPRMDGSELIRAVLDIRPDLPAIICTGHSDRMNREKAARLGVAELITKPLIRGKIAAAIQNALGQKAAADSELHEP